MDRKDDLLLCALMGVVWNMGLYGSSATMASTNLSYGMDFTILAMSSSISLSNLPLVAILSKAYCITALHFYMSYVVPLQ